MGDKGGKAKVNAKVEVRDKAARNSNTSFFHQRNSPHEKKTLRSSTGSQLTTEKLIDGNSSLATDRWPLATDRLLANIPKEGPSHPPSH